MLPGFEAPTRHRQRGELAVYEGDRHCRRCTHGLVLRLGTFVQDALFYHGGYGASEAIDVDVCLSCGHANRGNVMTVRPMRRSGTPVRPRS
jgi:hypothetical protein